MDEKEEAGEIIDMAKEISERQKEIISAVGETVAGSISQIIDAVSRICSDLQTDVPETIKNLADWLNQLYGRQISGLTSRELACLIGSHSGANPEKEIAVIREETMTYIRQNSLKSLTVGEFFQDKDDETSIYQTVIQRVRKRLDMPERGDAKSAGDDLANLPAPSPLTRPKTLGLSNDRLVNVMIDSTKKQIKELDITGESLWWWGVNQKGRKEKRDVPLYISSVYMDQPVKTSRFITSEDMAVFDVVCTIIHYLQQNGEAKPYYITPEEIWRKENGIVGSRKTPSPKQKAEVRAHMDKMRFTRLLLDLRGEIDMHGLSINDCRVRKGMVDTYYIKADYVQVEDESRHVYDAYRIDEIPFLYSYCEAKKAVLYFDYDLLDTKSVSVPASKDNVYTVGVRRYLMQQIKLMYMRERHNVEILYETVYTATGVPSPENRGNPAHAAQEDRKKISEILDAWTEKRWILGHEKVKKGRTYIGERVDLNPKNFAKEKESEKE